MPIIEIQGLGNVEFPNTMSHEDIVKAIQSNIMPKIQATQPAFGVDEQPITPSILQQKPQEKTATSTAVDVAKDLGISGVQGLLGAKEAAVGIASIPTFGLLGKAEEAAEKALFGGTSKDARKALQKLKSEELQAEEEKVSKTFKDEGTIAGFKEAVTSPRVLAGTITESLPSMVGGAGIGRAIYKAGSKALGAEMVGAELPGYLTRKFGDKVAPILAGAAGESIISAGSSAESTRQQNESGLLTPQQSALSTLSGVLTGAFGILGGKVANKIGIGDVDTMLVKGTTKQAQDAVNKVQKSTIRKAFEGALSESTLEELPQSLQEQALQNIAQGRDWKEGLAEAGTMGFLAGGIMGGGAAALSKNAPPPTINDLHNIIKKEFEAQQGELAGTYNIPPETETPPAEGVPPAPPKTEPRVVTETQLLNHATTRLAELDAKANGTPAQETTDENGNKITIPEQQAQPMTEQEVAEHNFLKNSISDPIKLAAGYGVSIGEKQATGSHDTQAALGELEGKEMPISPIYQAPAETKPAEPEKPVEQETPPTEEKPPIVVKEPPKVESTGKVIDNTGKEHTLPTVSDAQAAGFDFQPINKDRPMYIKTDLNGVMSMIYNLFGDHNQYTNISNSKYKVTSDKNQVLPKTSNKNQVSVEFRPDTLSGRQLNDNEFFADDTAHRAIESFTIHNPTSKLSVTGAEARLGANYLKKFFNVGNNPDGSITYTLKRVKSETEKEAENEKLSKEYLEHINRPRGKLKYKYTRKRKPGLNTFQQSINQHENIGEAFKDVLARLENALANNQFNLVSRDVDSTVKTNVYAGEDPSMVGIPYNLTKEQIEMYVDIIKHLMKIDPVMKTHLFMDPYIVGGKYHTTVGFYNRVSTTLALFANANLPTLVHEAIHAATVHYIEMHPNDPKVLKLKEILKASRAKDKKTRGDWKLYGNTNLKEFIAEAFSDLEFITHLKNIDPIFDKSESTSVFDNIKTIVAKMMQSLGINVNKDRSAFDEVMDLSSELFTGKTLEGYKYDLGHPLDAETEARAPFKPETAWHAGDLGYAKRDTLGTMAGRSTGHFGTGVYFVGKKFREGSWFGSRPQHKVDFKDYNMFRPKNREDAFQLHEQLRQINGLENEDNISDHDVTMIALRLSSVIPRISYHKLEDIIKEEHAKAREIIKSSPNQRPIGFAKSLSTMVMEALGYEGIDVRGIPDLDNSTYGSVIYKENLEPISKQYNKAEKNFKSVDDLAEFLGLDKVRAIMASPMMDDIRFRLFGFITNKAPRDIFKYTVDKNGVKHVFILPDSKQELASAADVILDKDNNLIDIDQYLVRKDANGKKDWIFIQSKKKSLEQDEGISENQRPLTEEEAQQEEGSRQIFNYRGDPIDIRKWEIPEQGPIAAKLSKWFQEFADEHVILTKVSNAIRALGRTISDMSDMEKKQELKNSKISDQLLRFANEEVNPILREMIEKGVSIEEINKYMHARHAESYNNRMNDINHKVDKDGNIIPYGLKDRASGMSTQEANEYLNSLDQEREQVLKDIADKWYDIRDKTQQLLVDSGQETQETIDLWREIFPDYVPLNREQEQQAVPTGLRTGVGIDTRGDFSKRALGSEKQVSSIVDALLYQRERAVARAENNEVGKSIYRLALENPNPDFWLPINPDAIRSREKLIQELEDMGYANAEEIADNIMAEPKERYLRPVRETDFVIDPTTGLPIPNGKEVVDARISRNARFGDNVLTLKVNGRERYIFFNQKDPNAVTMVRALKNLDAQTLGRFVRANRFINHYLGQVYTVLNPVFGIVNGIRDYPFGMANLSTTPIRGKQIEVSKKIFPAMMGIMGVLRNERAGDASANSKWQKIYKEATEAGFQTSNRYGILNTGEDQSYIDQTLKNFTDNNAKQAFRYVINMTYDFASTIENGVRLAAYQQMREEGYSPQEAASVAKNLTINFDKKGARTATLRSLYLFFNASVRGTVRLAETLNPKTNPSAPYIIGGGMLLGVMQAILMAGGGFKDDDPPEYIRERNLIIPTGDGKYITLPMPYGLNILPNTGRIMTEAAIDVNKNGKKAKLGKKALAWSNSFFSTFSPFGNQGLTLNALVPSAMEPFAGVGITNKNSFGQTISKQDSYTRPTPGYMRTKENGTAAGKEVARWLNLFTGGTDYAKGLWSPTGDDIDFLASSFTGPVLGSAAKTAKYINAQIEGEEVPAYQTPILGRFRGELESKPVITSRFYNNINAMYEHELTLKNLRGDKKATLDYIAKHPDARAYRRAEHVEAQINGLNAKKKKFQMRGAPKETLQRIDNQKIIIMNRFNDQLDRIRNQSP